MGGESDVHDLMHVVKSIYRRLQDEESKRLFQDRLMYALTEEPRYMDQIKRTFFERIGSEEIIDFCKEHIDEVVIYGVGNDLTVMSYLCPEFKYRYLCDSDIKKQKEGWNGFKVMSPEELIRKRNEMYVLVLTSKYHKEIVQYLLENGFNEERIIDLGGRIKALHQEQYFDKMIMKPQPGEIFIDGGCYDGETDRFFVKWCSGDYRKIFAFEPDVANYRNCLEKLKKEDIRDLILYNKGLWDRETTLSFQETGGVGSKIGDGANTIKIPTVAIDDVVGEDGVTFIKLDVEGAELKALQGAEKTIRKYRPRLAICIYHKLEDVIEIPRYILSLHEDYRLYIRHYLLTQYETVLYAI